MKRPHILTRWWARLLDHSLTIYLYYLLARWLGGDRIAFAIGASWFIGFGIYRDWKHARAST